ncbi:hypothetical protein [Streptomyces xylophagus]|uniref:hypothetical protein n=1 Tax=Streptomyces xylophagus TaxID=285514 RepID=UPI0005BA7505|nr:hypothetical protein [Streptomyces xylophagus]
MRRPDRRTLRSAGFVLLLTGVFVMVNTQVVYAASNSSETGDLLAPLNITSSEGVPINGYDLGSEPGSIIDFKAQALAFALSGLFTLIRLLVGLAGWAIQLAFQFPLLKILIRPAQKVADAYDHVVVDTLGLKGLLLAWSFVFAGFMIVRGRVGRGLGEIFLTLLIAAFAASAFVRPDYLLTQHGPLGQAQQVAASVAQQSVNSYDWGGKIASTDPCAGMAGNAELTCLQLEDAAPVSAAEVARPLQDSITNALIVKPYMLLEYGRVLDPAKASDRKAYAIHLMWVSGGYKASTTEAADCSQLEVSAQSYCEQAQQEKKKTKDACRWVIGDAKEFCERGRDAKVSGNTLPELTPGSALLEATNPVVNEEDQEFAAFLSDMKKAGPVGKACAAYAEKPTWWRVGGAALLLVAALFICGMLLSSAIVLLGTQGICAAAAAAGGVTFVAGMLPGPPRQSVWKWLSLWGIAILALLAICAFIPFFGIAVDATITNGPDLVVERILLIDVLAIAGAAGHRRLLSGITSFGRRTAMRMRYAKVGGTHLPGDTSELGAALAMNSPAAMGGYGGGLRMFAGGGGGRFGLLGTRYRLLSALTSLVDGAGMPVDTGGILADATAEAGRGLAPLTAAAAVGGLGARLGLKGSHWLLIGRRPDREQLAKWRKPTADGDPGGGGPWGSGPGGPGGPGGGPGRPGGPPDRYRNDQGQVVNRNNGQFLHDQNSDRTLLSTRAHNRLVRFRGYRILNRGGRAAYGGTVGLPANVRRAGAGGSRYTQDAQQQLRVWGNTGREDARAWVDTGLAVARVSGQTGRLLSRRPATTTTPATPAPAVPARPTAPPRPTAPGGRPPSPGPGTPPRAGGGPTPPAPAPAPAPAPSRTSRLAPGPTARPSGGTGPAPTGGHGTGGNAGTGNQDQLRERMRQAEALRAMRERWRIQDGEDE